MLELPCSLKGKKYQIRSTFTAEGKRSRSRKVTRKYPQNIVKSGISFLIHRNKLTSCPWDHSLGGMRGRDTSIGWSKDTVMLVTDS